MFGGANDPNQSYATGGGGVGGAGGEKRAEGRYVRGYADTAGDEEDAAVGGK